MASIRIKTVSVLTASFISMFFFLGFVSFSLALIFFFMYRLVTRRVHPSDIRRSGIPALGAIFFIGMLSTVAFSPHHFSAWNVGKDIYFFLAPILMLALGLTHINNAADFENVLKTSAKTLTIVSILQFSDFLLSGSVFTVSLDTRYKYQMDSSASLLALLIIISLRPTLGSLTGRSVLSVLAFLNLFLIVASLSRVNLSIAVISLIFVYSHSRFLRGTALLTTLFMISAPLLQIPAIIPSEAISGHSGFLGKALNSFQEFRVSDYSDFGEVNENWRGYEAFLGIDQVSRVGGWANLIGIGFGSFAVGPFEGKLTQIPFFHNGFITVFLKTGLLGIAIFAFFSARLYITSRSAFLQTRPNLNPQLAPAALLTILLTISMLLHTLSTHGLYYSKTTLELFFIGLSIYVISSSRRNGAATDRFRKDENRIESRASLKVDPL